MRSARSDGCTTGGMAAPAAHGGRNGRGGGPGHHHSHHHEHGHDLQHAHGRAGAEPEEDVSLTASEQAHFDRIASAFHAYYHMNIKRVEKARRDFRRSAPTCQVDRVGACLGSRPVDVFICAALRGRAGLQICCPSLRPRWSACSGACKRTKSSSTWPSSPTSSLPTKRLAAEGSSAADMVRPLTDAYGNAARMERSRWQLRPKVIDASAVRPDDADKVRSTLRQCMRGWSAEVRPRRPSDQAVSHDRSRRPDVILVPDDARRARPSASSVTPRCWMPSPSGSPTIGV